MHLCVQQNSFRQSSDPIKTRNRMLPAVLHRVRSNLISTRASVRGLAGGMRSETASRYEEAEFERHTDLPE